MITLSRHNQSGFSLLEIIVVLGVISLLLSLIIPRYSTHVDHGKKQVHTCMREVINAQLSLYYLNNGSYPAYMSNMYWDDPGDSGSYVRYFPEGVESTCNQSVSWVIHSDGYIDMSGHSGHE
ncbi:MAG: prepilin-type N-terminal cleavage/methylation domain-containing protein [bacterium]